MSLRPWLLGPVLALACTAPPERAASPAPGPVSAPAVAPPAPAAQPAWVRVELSAPGMPAADLEASAVAPIEAALSGLRGVKALYARTDDGAASLELDWPAPDLAAAREAIAAARRALPSALGSPVLRLHEDLPAVIVRFDLDRPTPESPPERPSASALEFPIEPFLRLPGVARVEWCGASETPGPEVVLDLDRLDGVPIDRVLAALRSVSAPPRAQIWPLSLAELAALPIAGTDRRLSDLAQLRERRLPAPCLDHKNPDAATVLVYPQRGADPAALAASFRGLDDARGPRPRIQVIPAEGEPAFGLLDLELDPGDAGLASLAECMRTAPGVRTWALVGPERAPERPTPLRLVVAPGPQPAGPAWSIGPVREALSACAPVRRASVVVPRVDADHVLTLRVVGPEPAQLASVADAAAAAASSVPGVTWVLVSAPRERPVIELERGGDPDALRLAAGAIELDVPGPAPLRVDLSPRPDTLERTLERLAASDGDRVVPLATRVRLQARREWGPRYRVDRRSAALVELRVRSAGDRDAVKAALAAQVRLPEGLTIELGDPGPPW